MTIWVAARGVRRSGLRAQLRRVRDCRGLRGGVSTGTRCGGAGQSGSISTPLRKTRTYSKGNRQRVIRIAVLAADVDLLLLDEPTSGLDPLMESVFRECIEERCTAGVAVPPIRDERVRRGVPSLRKRSYHRGIEGRRRTVNRGGR